IQKASIELNPLTVIVGANGTGKSNLIKALDFISDVVDLGVSQAINNHGGFDEILPKQYKKLRGLEIYFNVSINLDPPKDWPVNYGALVANYEMGVKKKRGGDLTISRESLTLNSI